MSDGFTTLDGEITMSLEQSSGVGSVANNLTTTDEGYALDARQGKVLDEKKLDKANVMNNINTSVPGYALDARQGKWLDENKIGFADVVNNLETNEISKPLSAAQGAALGSSVAALAHTVEELGNTLLSSVYQVGDIYITTNNTSPASIFGGSWEQIKDRFLLGAGTSYAAGQTGGAATHTLTESEIPSHYHDLAQQNTSGTTKLGLWDTYIKSDYQIFDQVYDSSQNIKAKFYGTRSTGGSAAHNNMPPYLTVYMWRRVA